MRLKRTECDAQLNKTKHSSYKILRKRECNLGKLSFDYKYKKCFQDSEDVEYIAPMNPSWKT